MKSVFLISLLTICVACASAQHYSMSMQTNSDNSGQSTATSISTMIVEAISRGVGFLFDILDIKVRSIRFLSSLYTTDNLILLKKLLNLALRFGNWLYAKIPDSTTQASIFSALFPQVNLDNGKEEQPQGGNVFQFSEQHTTERVPYVTINNLSDDDDGNSKSSINKRQDDYEDVMNLRRLINGEGY